MLRRACLVLALVSAVILTGTYRLAMAAPDAMAAVDAVSAPSLVVTITGVTQTQITVNYTFDERAGTRNFCYAVAPATPSTVCVVTTPRALTGTMSVTNLKAGTAYNYALSAIDPTGRHKTSVTRGTFTTQGAPVAVARPQASSKAPKAIPGILAHSRDLMGRARRNPPSHPAR